MTRSEIQTARNLGEQLLSLAQRAQDPALLLQAHHALGPTYIDRRRLGLCPDPPGAGHRAV